MASNGCTSLGTDDVLSCNSGEFSIVMLSPSILRRVRSQNGTTRNARDSPERTAETPGGKDPRRDRSAAQRDNRSGDGRHPAADPESGRDRLAPSADPEPNEANFACKDLPEAQTTHASALVQKPFRRT